MIDYWFLGKCFLVGVSASSTVGPIFILTFNNGAMRGFLKGFFTALGSAIGDGFLLFLGLMGALSFLKDSQYSRLAIDLAGGITLIMFGIIMFVQRKNHLRGVKVASSGDTLFLSAAKSFLSTVLNPLTLLFFMFIGSQMMASSLHITTTSRLIVGAAMASLGSLSILGSIAYIASTVGRAINHKKLSLITVITAGIFTSIGSYFVLDAIRILFVLQAK